MASTRDRVCSRREKEGGGRAGILLKAMAELIVCQPNKRTEA